MAKGGNFRDGKSDTVFPSPIKACDLEQRSRKILKIFATEIGLVGGMGTHSYAMDCMQVIKNKTYLSGELNACASMLGGMGSHPYVVDCMKESGQ